MRNTNNILFVEYAQANNHLREIACILNDSSHREIDRGHFVVKPVHDNRLNASGYFAFHVLPLLKNLNQKCRPLSVGYERIEDWKILLLKKEKLTKTEEKDVKLAATHLLQILFDAKNKILIQEWHKEKATQERVRREIKKILNDALPHSYDRNVFAEKTEVVFQHFYELAQMGAAFAA